MTFPRGAWERGLPSSPGNGWIVKPVMPLQSHNIRISVRWPSKNSETAPTLPSTSGICKRRTTTTALRNTPLARGACVQQEASGPTEGRKRQ